MGLQPILEQRENADACDCRIDSEIRRTAHAYHQRAGRIDADEFAISLELPRQRRTACETPPDAGVVKEVVRMPRAAMAVEISR